MKILVTGATGLIGSKLLPFLRNEGHEIITLARTRNSKGCCAYFWNPDQNELDAAYIEGMDAVIHLAGENIAGRWTASKKTKIRESRINGTRLLRNTLSELQQRPKVFVCASAIGIYGHRGDSLLKENHEPGSGFLAEVCRAWEAASILPSQKGIRVVNLRIGVVLSTDGGALAKMLLPFKMGAGGVVGSGKQHWSWIALDDVVGAIYHAINSDSLKGPLNLVAPNPATNREFTQVLGKVLSRPTLLPMPGFAAKLAFGEMGDELLLASTKVDSSKLTDSGYEFKYPELEEAFRYLLGK